MPELDWNRVLGSALPLAAVLWYLWIGFKPDTNLAGGLWGMVAVAVTVILLVGWFVVLALFAIASLRFESITLSDCLVAANLLCWVPGVAWLTITTWTGAR